MEQEHLLDENQKKFVASLELKPYQEMVAASQKKPEEKVSSIGQKIAANE